MLDKVVKCTNCGLISQRDHLLPLCDGCFKGLEDYEDFVAKSRSDVRINIDKTPHSRDDFLQL